MNSSTRWKRPKLMIGGTVHGHIGTVEQKIDFMKSVLQTLEQVSPWSLPIEVSGVSKAASDLRIDANYSQFVELTLEALISGVPSIKKKNVVDLDCDDLKTVGLDNGHLTFVSRQLGSGASEIQVSFSLASTLSTVPINGISIIIFDYFASERNNWWGQNENALTVMSALIDLVDPRTMDTLDPATRFKVLESGVDQYTMSWISYTTTPTFVEALLELPESQRYKNGVLVKLADSFEMSCSEEIFERVREIRDYLRSRGATNWYLDA